MKFRGRHDGEERFAEKDINNERIVTDVEVVV